MESQSREQLRGMQSADGMMPMRRDIEKRPQNKRARFNSGMWKNQGKAVTFKKMRSALGPI
jgi:hypothetical protein